MKRITIYDLLPLIPESKFNKYVFFSSCSKQWFICKEKPTIEDDGWRMPAHDICGAFNLSSFINIAPFDGDWKDSLIKIEHFHQQEKMVKEKEHIIHIEDFPLPHPTGFMSESQLKRMFEHKEEE